MRDLPLKPARATISFYADLRNIVLKTAGLADVRRKALQRADVDWAFVFGSIASGSARSERDIDLMVIGPLGLRQLSKALHGESYCLR